MNETRQEHVAEDGTVTDASDEANELRIANLETDKRILKQETDFLYELLHERCDEISEYKYQLRLERDGSKVKLLSENGRLRDGMIEIRRTLKDSEELLLP